jgi:hypothetical protein
VKCTCWRKPESLNDRGEDAVEQMHEGSIAEAPAVGDVEGALDCVTVRFERQSV